MLNFVIEQNYKFQIDEMCQRLVTYKKEHIDTWVPQSYKEDQKLRRWVNEQRTAYRKKKIGFVWDANTKVNK